MSLLRILSIMAITLVPNLSIAQSGCEGLTRSQCERKIEDIKKVMAYIERKSEQDEAATNAALNKCIASLPTDFTGPALIGCMSKEIGR